MGNNLPALSHPEQIDSAKMYILKRPRDLGGGTVEVLGEELLPLVLEPNRGYSLMSPPAMVAVVDVWDEPGNLDWVDLNRAAELLGKGEKFVVDSGGNILPYGHLRARFGPIADRAWSTFHWNRVREAEEAARAVEPATVESQAQPSEETPETPQRPRRPSPWTKKEVDEHE